MDAAAPLLCAGITVFCPMKDNNLVNSAPKKIGVVGLGGLGHVAVKFGKAFGHHVTVISTSPSKEKEAKERLGADDFLISTDLQQMQVFLELIIYYYHLFIYKIKKIYYYQSNKFFTKKSDRIFNVYKLRQNYFNVTITYF